MANNVETNERPEYDKVLQDIAEYVLNYKVDSKVALETARYCLMDTIGCGLLALRFPECIKHLGPIVEGTNVPHGARVPGTSFVLDPIKAAWDIGCIIRWLDYNDTWLAAEWGHPSDNLGGILAVSDHLSQKRIASGKAPLVMLEVLEAMVMAHEIQGCLALENSFNAVGLDHVVLVKVATTAVVAKLYGANKEQMLSALSHAWVDGQSLRTYRHAPNAGSRKSWAAGDATSRGVRLVNIVLKGEMGIPSALSAPKWGFYDVSFKSNTFKSQRSYGSYVMENVLFKISYPAEFHSQTAVEAAVQLHEQVKDRLSQVDRIEITTHKSAIRIISKKGPLANSADRDHCLQYMVAVPLLFGSLIAEHYEDSFHDQHSEIDELREKMVVKEDPRYSKEYLEPEKRSIANALQVFFKDGSSTDKVAIEYPIGHKSRRDDGIPLLKSKFKNNLATRFIESKVDEIFSICGDMNNLKEMPVHDFMSLFVL